MSEKPEMNLDEMPDPMMEFIDRKMLQDQKRPSGISLFFKGILNVLTLGIFRNRLFPKNDLILLILSPSYSSTIYPYAGIVISL